MTPTLTDYLHGLRRLWWVPLIGLLLGLGAGVLLAQRGTPAAGPTTGHVLFTFRMEDSGDGSAGAARNAEAAVAGSRLEAYVRLAAASEYVRDLLIEQGIDEPPTLATGNGVRTFGSAPLTLALPGAGVVEVRLSNGHLGPVEATRLVAAISSEVARSAIATDSIQGSPSLLPNPVVTAPQAVQTTQSSRPSVVPALLLTLLGLAIVYLVVWREGRIHSRRDVEDRLGARVVGDWAARPSDPAAIALALTRDRPAGTRALIAPVGPALTDAVATLGDLIASVGPELSLNLTLTPTSEAVRQPASVVAAAHDVLGPAFTKDLDIAVATHGLDAAALRTAVDCDIAVLVVEYGTTRFRDLTTAGHTLAQVTSAEIAVIGVLRLRGQSLRLPGDDYRTIEPPTAAPDLARARRG